MAKKVEKCPEPFVRYESGCTSRRVSSEGLELLVDGMQTTFPDMKRTDGVYVVDGNYVVPPDDYGYGMI